MADKVRKAVCDGLIQVCFQGGYSHLVLGQLISKGGLSKKEAAFASVLLYGTLERRLTLDMIIDAYAKAGIHSLSPEILTVLRLSLYQILYLESIPDFSAVDEGVKLASAYRQSSAGALVNGLLRNVIRSRGNLFPKGFPTKEEYLAYRFSCPTWLIRQLTQEYGESAAKVILANSLGSPPLFIRVNPLKTDVDSLAARLRKKNIPVMVHKALPNCICLVDAGNIYDSQEFEEGLFHVQDLSSQICSLAVDAKPGDTVLDLCAAPGGKSFTMGQQMENRGKLYSLDLHPTKVNLIRSGAKRLGLTLLEAQPNDATVYNPALSQADCVLCDVPCSGFGIIRRKPEIKYKTPEQIQGLPPLQEKILEQAARYVKVGGRLVYSTCTLLPQENQQQTQAFLHRHREFVKAPVGEAVRGYCQGEDTSAMTLLTTEQSDGFYIQCFERKG